MANCIIVHGSHSTKESARKKPNNLKNWQPWIKSQLESKGIKTSNELYPEDWKPSYWKWKKVFEKNTVNKNTTLIGHSAGAAFLLRWLSENNTKIHQLVLVAPYAIKSEKYARLNNLCEFEYDSQLAQNINEICIFYSNKDAEEILKSALHIHEKLGGELIDIPHYRHFGSKEMKSEKFPELLEKIVPKN